MKPLLTWCRKCVAAHPEGQHLKTAATPYVAPKGSAMAKAIKAAPVQAVGFTVTTEEVVEALEPKHPMIATKSHPPQPVSMPKPKRDQTKAAKKVRKAAAKAAVTAETRAPAVMKAPKRQKPFKDPAKELARRKAQKAAQMRRYRSNRKKRLEEQGLNANGELK